MKPRNWSNVSCGRSRGSCIRRPHGVRGQSPWKAAWSRLSVRAVAVCGSRFRGIRFAWSSRLDELGISAMSPLIFGRRSLGRRVVQPLHRADVPQPATPSARYRKCQTSGPQRLHAYSRDKNIIWRSLGNCNGSNADQRFTLCSRRGLAAWRMQTDCWSKWRRGDYIWRGPEVGQVRRRHV